MFSVDFHDPYNMTDEPPIDDDYRNSGQNNYDETWLRELAILQTMETTSKSLTQWNQQWIDEQADLLSRTSWLEVPPVIPPMRGFSDYKVYGQIENNNYF